MNTIFMDAVEDLLAARRNNDPAAAKNAELQMAPWTFSAMESQRFQRLYEETASAAYTKTLRSGLFVKACELAQIPATRRQASKFFRHRGLANQYRHQARKALAEAKE